MIKFSIDRGGTFSDIYAEYNGKTYVKKVLSEDPDNYSDASMEGIRRVIEEIAGKSVEQNNIPPGYIKWIRMGTTIAANALLERKGERTALIITKGFGDLLEIGYQDRPDLFDLNIKRRERLYDDVIEIDERVIPDGNGFRIIKEPDIDKINSSLQVLKRKGIESLAIVLMHSYGFDKHEKMIAGLAEEIGFRNISLSGDVMPSVKITDRGYTTVIDAYLTPKIRIYQDSFRRGLPGKINDSDLLFMQSGGGLTEADKFRGSNAILSGPAGGVVGYAESFYNGRPIIGFDMGGTSTDVSRFDGVYEISYENDVDGVIVKTPHVDIMTVAAGGGSRLFYRNSMLQVGPESSGSHPGPVCYRKGGYLSITDANLVLGRILPDFFPVIFGEKENEPLDKQASVNAFRELIREINLDYTRRGIKPLSIEETALGFIKVANENMIKPIKEVSVARGFDINKHVLACFGGAGPQHACSIARILGIREVYIHRYSGILSAYGIGMADIVKYNNMSLNLRYCRDNFTGIENSFEKLKNEGMKDFSMGYSGNITVTRFLSMRFEGTDNPLEIEEPEDGNFGRRFRETHKRKFGFEFLEKPVFVDEARIVLTAQVEKMSREKISMAGNMPEPVDSVKSYYNDGYHETLIYLLDDLGSGNIINGPAIIINNTSTILVEPGAFAEITEYGDIKIVIESAGEKLITEDLDPVSLSIFNNMFMSTAEQMGKVLQKTAVSTNIKERLDFSCALFDETGNLVANAPHIPVHLGSMSHTVKSIRVKFKNKIKEGDIFISNVPCEGGSHLPDITIITPCMISGVPGFYVASRGHHADVGGTPGSMPPFSRSLAEEGAVIESFKIVEDERFNEPGLRELLAAAGARRIDDNISDIKAQISANRKGIELMLEMIDRYSFKVVRAYMGHIQDVSEKAVREMLKKLPGENRVSAVDYLDDGTALRLNILIDRGSGEALFDFSDSDMESFFNQNCPVSVTSSAVTYVMRALIHEDLPLNEGFLKPVKLKFSPMSILNPSRNAAVAGGNVTTSQRIVDLILRAFNYCAASCGCMNNFSFGNDYFGYYETIAGGSGAGDGYNGTSAVHTHMTNTRITDPEIFERRYPAVLREFSIRKGSGGEGRFTGGDGIVREIEFLDDMDVSLLTERRSFAPWGLYGGGDGKRGKNILIKDDGRINLPGKIALKVSKGERIRIKTPGGGGYGHKKVF